MEGKLIQRTKNNDIEVEEIIHVLSVNLKEVDEAEEILKQRQKDEEVVSGSVMGGHTRRLARPSDAGFSLNFLSGEIQPD